MYTGRPGHDHEDPTVKPTLEKPHDSAKVARRVAAAALAGTAMEWYDYYPQPSNT